MDKLLGFTPDVDPTTPGVMTDVVNMVPDEKGMKGAPTTVTPSDVPVLAAACIGAAVTTKLDDTRRIFAGTTTNLYELVTGSWVNVSAGTYTGNAETRWSFTQFGDSTLAANLTDTIQRSPGTGSFAAVSGAPKARILFSVQGFVMALHTDDGTYGDSPDRWWCCAAFNDTDWTPSITTQSATGRLVSTQGRFTAGGKLGDYAVAYKERSIYLGQYVGPPVVWDWQEIPGGEAGCVGQEAWCDVGGSHFIVGMDNFWIFDGSRPTKIGNGVVRDWFYANSSPLHRYRTRCAYDKQNNLVWVFYPSIGSSEPDAALVYHTVTQQWGAVNIASEAVVNYVGSGIAIDDLGTVSSTIDGLSDYTFDSQFWLVGGRSLAIFNDSHQLQTVTGNPATSGYTTGDYGDDDAYSLLTKVRVRFAPGEKPTDATMTSQTKQDAGDDLTTASTSTWSDGKFDALDSSRWHRLTFEFTGRVTAVGHELTLIPEGTQ